MNPSSEEFNKLKAQVAELVAWKEEKEKNQLHFPLDIQSVQVLNEAFRSARFDRINVLDIFFQASLESPVEEGQMRFFNDRATQTFRGVTTKGVFTGSFDLTAV